MTTEPKVVEEQQDNQKNNDKEYNFAQLRKQFEQSEKEKQAAIQKAILLEKQIEEQNKKYSYKEDDEEDDSEPYVDHKKLGRKLSKLEEKIASKIDQKAEEKARYILEQQRQSDFLRQNPDFQEILQHDTLEKFANKYPEIAEQMLEMPDTFARQKLLYQNIKALRVHEKDQPKESIQDTIDKNRKNPYYMPSSIGTAPYANGGDFSPAGQKNAYDKIQELKKRLRI